MIKMLCTRCEDIFQGTLPSREAPHHPYINHLYRAAQKGCSLCILIWDELFHENMMHSNDNEHSTINERSRALINEVNATAGIDLDHYTSYSMDFFMPLIINFRLGKDDFQNNRNSMRISFNLTPQPSDRKALFLFGILHYSWLTLR
jgi:hypothetical protein